MSNYSLPESIIEILQQEISGAKPGYQFEKMGDGGMHLFFIPMPNEKKLSESWLLIVNMIALHFQSKLDVDFEIWNIYIFFLLPKPASRDLKYKIENDTFSSRKIIVDATLTNEEIVAKYISCHLSLGSTTNASPKGREFQKNAIIWTALKGKKVRKQKRTAEAGEVLDEIKRHLKKNQNEI